MAKKHAFLGGGSKDSDKITLSIIVPCYNESSNVLRFYKTLKNELYNGEASKFVGDFEIVFVDDGSSDDTGDKVREIGDSRVSLVRFSRNFGKESAMLAGLRTASKDLVSIMDCDLQDPPSLLSTMILDYIKSGGELKMIIARRKNRTGDGAIRAYFSDLFYKVNNLLSPVKLHSGVRDFRLMDREVVSAILSMGEYHRFSKAIFEFVGFRKKYLDFDYIDREQGSSKWSFFKLLAYGLEGIISFSTLPLKLITYIGVVIFAISSLYGLFIIISTLLFGNPVSGYPTIVTLIAFFGGLQIIMLGIIGTYIARIYEQGKHRPHYFVESSALKNNKTKK